MIRIPCPHCGLRDHNEFVYLGDAGLRRPESAQADDAWFDYVYYRANPAGSHQELWHHRHGCRSWLVVTRDTRTHDITGVQFARQVGWGG